ncbi:uncharacterized protein LOC120798961 [Xiphias gladius]|uniref:uncharacterized protein LOC120798961 n=1 Tax=Xiphias gladius TaxID=8245 RepID=UPI001A999370|nr:uncharacterized protein LOC120798961 [Xiphias gladius]
MKPTSCLQSGKNHSILVSLLRTSRFQKVAKQPTPTTAVVTRNEKEVQARKDEDSRFEGDGMQAWDNTHCYRVVSVTADHQSGGSAGHFRSRRGSQLTQRLQPAPRLQSQAQQRPCPRQGRETPGQTTETLPAADCLMLTTERIQAKAQKAGRRKKRKREGESELYDGELTAGYRPDREEKAPSVHGLGLAQMIGVNLCPGEEYSASLGLEPLQAGPRLAPSPLHLSPSPQPS